MKRLARKCKISLTGRDEPTKLLLPLRRPAPKSGRSRESSHTEVFARAPAEREAAQKKEVDQRRERN